MKEQLTGKLDRGKVAVIFAVMAIALLLFLSGSSSQENEKFRLGVGEDAWKDMVQVNITDEVNPETIKISSGETLVWNNRNSFTVTVKIEGVERSYEIEPDRKVVFRPASGVDYTVESVDGRVGAGKVVVQSR